MLKESVVEKAILRIFTVPQLQRGESVIFFKHKSRFRNLQPVCSRVCSI